MTLRSPSLLPDGIDGASECKARQETNEGRGEREGEGKKATLLSSDQGAMFGVDGLSFTTARLRALRGGTKHIHLFPSSLRVPSTLVQRH